MKVLSKIICIIMLTALFLSGCSKDSATDRKDSEAKLTELNKKTALLFQEGKYNEAIQAGQEALAFAKQTFGPEDIKLAATIFNLAGTYYIQGRYDEAGPLFEEALKIYITVLGENHPNVAQVLQAQANMHYIQNKFPEAKDTFNRSLAIIVSAYGNNHPAVPDILASLGEINKIQCKLDTAISLYKAALQIKPNDILLKTNLEKIEVDRKNINDLMLGFQERLLLDSENHILQWRLGNLYRCDKQMDKAIVQYNNALSLKPDYFDALLELAEVYTEKGEFDLAIKTYKKALDLRKDRSELIYSIASTYAQQNNIEESIIWFKKLLDIGYKNWKRLEDDKNLDNIRASSGYNEMIQRMKG